MTNETIREQIEYYQNLSEVEKSVYKAFAIKAEINNPGEIADLLKIRIKVTQKLVGECIAEALSMGILLSTNDNRHIMYKRYSISVPFMIYIYTELNDWGIEWSLGKNPYPETFYAGRIHPVHDLKNLLYGVLYENSVSDSLQNSILENPELSGQLHISDYPEYMRNFHKLNISLINTLLLNEVERITTFLAPVNEIIAKKALFAGHLHKEIADRLLPVENQPDFHQGKFQSILTRNNSFSHPTVEAIHLFLHGDNELALKLFDQQLKELRKQYKNIRTFPASLHNFYYIALLIALNPEDLSARAQKMLAAYAKNRFTRDDIYFEAILHSVLNSKEKKTHYQEIVLSYLAKYSGFNSVFLIAIAYLAEFDPPHGLGPTLIKNTNKAYESGYYAIAYEAAYVINIWFGNEESEELYTKVAGKMDYQPACSHIKRQEEWEKNLNLLTLAIGGNKPAKAETQTGDATSRVVYFFNPDYNHIQPVLQSRNARGEWSKGRNIALKTFNEGKTPGMTEQDHKISKTLKHYRGSYYEPESYEFTSKSYVQLIGHPFIFLAGTNEVPVEFIAAQPIITVSQKTKGYALESNIRHFHSAIFVQKETNTRYRIYNLSQTQMNLLRLLTENNIAVPEQGKTRLIQLLGEISTYATVHSDLVSSPGYMDQTLKAVEPDNRIRVQLLPLGDGLKAELFAKPFGTMPPYCKPGVGGKVLIANNKGEQLQVKRDLQAELQNANLLLNDIQLLESVNSGDDLISFENPLDSLHLLDILATHAAHCIVEWPDGERFKIRSSAGFSQLKLRIKSKNNWFELDGELQVDEDTVLSIQQLLGLLKSGHDRFIELKNGEFIALSAELKKRLLELNSFTSNGKSALQINKFASVALRDFFGEVKNLKTDTAWKEFQQRIENQSDTAIELPETLQAELRPYQDEGFRWMARLAEWEGGACLADDMGLGKTIQALAILLHRQSKGPALVVCPVSVVGNWLAEAQRFAPTLRCITLNNTNRQHTLGKLEAGDVLVTTYGLLQSEVELFSEKDFATVVLDEAHVIKNYNTKTSKASMQLKAGFRLALTGTPLQNHLGETWNLFNFINPGLLGNLNHFTDTFIKPENENARKLLKKLIKPFILRRTKSTVLDELPPKTEIVKKVQLSETEMAFYEALRRQALQQIESTDNDPFSKQFQVLAEITKLRQASCNPRLVDGNIEIESSKLATFLDIVDELTENNHRALVFSQFVSHLAIVRQALDKKGIPYQYLDGSTPMARREVAVKEFQAGNGQLFLISLKAGGLGLNLTAADYVIHLDPWWNPAVEDQASDRAHRIGQSRPVTIYRLVAENTIEEKIIRLHVTKRDLAESLLEGSDQSAKLSLSELVALIKEH